LTPEADRAAGPTLSHVIPADSTPPAAENPKDIQNAESELEPEPMHKLLTLHDDPAPFLSRAESEPNNLWDEAYKALREEDPKLIDAYEKDLLTSQNRNQQGMSVQIGFFQLKEIRHHF
jgi:hypothetical protein